MILFAVTLVVPTHSCGLSTAAMEDMQACRMSLCVCVCVCVCVPLCVCVCVCVREYLLAYSPQNYGWTNLSEKDFLQRLQIMTFHTWNMLVYIPVLRKLKPQRFS